MTDSPKAQPDASGVGSAALATGQQEQEAIAAAIGRVDELLAELEDAGDGCTEVQKQLREENEALLLKLQDVQEQLERYYLLCSEYSKILDSAQKLYEKVLVSSLRTDEPTA